MGLYGRNVPSIFQYRFFEIQRYILLSNRSRCPNSDHGNRNSSDAIYRSCRKISAIPFIPLASRRNGRTDSCFGSHTCCYNGDFRSLSSNTNEPCTSRGRRVVHRYDMDHRALYSSVCSYSRNSAKRYQKSTCLFHSKSTWFHVRSSRVRAIRRCHLPYDYACLLQSTSVPWCRICYPWNASRTGYAKIRSTQKSNANNSIHFYYRLAGYRRNTSVFWLLVKG